MSNQLLYTAIFSNRVVSHYNGNLNVYIQ